MIPTDDLSVVIPEIINIIENKDYRTLCHASGVQRFGGLIMEKLGLSSELFGLFYSAAILHDLGKIFWPDDFLHKNINLDREQFLNVMKHPDSATHFLKMAGVDSRVISIVRHHHERYDGNTEGKHPGYPDGLKGEEIPFLSRILAVADTYEALVVGRPYRQPVSKIDAVKIIVGEKNKQFDPRVVDAFIAAIYDFEKERDSDPEFIRQLSFFLGFNNFFY